MAYEVTRVPSLESEDIQDVLICRGCNKVVKDPVMLPCQHVVCAACVSTHCPVEECPRVSARIYKEDTSGISIPFQNLLNRLRIKCDFEGCNEVCPLSSLASHVKTCPFSGGEILCEYGCGIKFPRRLGHSCLQKTVKELKDQLEDQSRTVCSLQESVSLLMTRLSLG